MSFLPTEALEPYAAEAVELQHDALDAAVAYSYVEAGKRRGLKSQHLRVLIALICSAFCCDEEGNLWPVSPFEPFTVRETDVLQYLSPRKADTLLGSAKPQDFRKHCDELEVMGLIQITPLANRAGDPIGGGRFRRIFDVALNLPRASRAPRYGHARRILLDAVDLKRLEPTKVAILSLAYRAAGDTCTDHMEPDDVQEYCGVTITTVLKHLPELGPEHGLAHWSNKKCADGRPKLFLRFCKSDGSENVLRAPELSGFVAEMKANSAQVAPAPAPEVAEEAAEEVTVAQVEVSPIAPGAAER